jgi:hypothetical protein
MTERLTAIVNEKYAYQGGVAHALNYVVGAMIGHDAAKGISPFTGLNVERVFSAVELLAERADLEITPFVSSWQSAVTSIDSPHFPQQFKSRLSNELLRGTDWSLETLFRSAVESITGAETGHTYRTLMTAMLSTLRSLVTIDHAEEVAYLSPLADWAAKCGSLVVATLNYDRSVEIMSESNGMPLTTGIESWNETGGAWNWLDCGINLMKLHGSVDWFYEPQGFGRPLAPSRVHVSTDPVPYETPALVFGQREKLRSGGPFLELLAEFSKALARSDILIVIGYSFRDEHINEQIRRWIGADSRRRITVVDPGFPA